MGISPSPPLRKRISDWMVITRFPLVPISTVYALVAALAVTRSLPVIIEWFVFALLFHVLAFTDNNACDWMVDIRNANKAEFPIGKSVSVKDVYRFEAIVSAVFIAYSIYLHVDPFILGTMVGFGLLYNRTSKSSLVSVPAVMLSYSPLPLAVYSGITHHYSIPIIMLVVYAMLYLVHNTHFMGSLKDLKYDDWNLMKLLGGRVEGDRIEVPTFVRFIPTIIKASSLIPLYFMYHYIPALVFFIIPIIASYYTFMMKTYNQRKMAIGFYFMSIPSTYAIAMAFIPVIGILNFIIIALFIPLWRFTFNYFITGFPANTEN